MKTTYYVTLPMDGEDVKVLRATTAKAKIKLAHYANDGIWCKTIDPKTSKKMIKDGIEFIKIQDL